MKRRLAILAGLFLLIGSINAQVVQKGVVLKYNGKQEKTPLEGVSLVVRGTGSTTSVHIPEHVRSAGDVEIFPL